MQSVLSFFRSGLKRLALGIASVGLLTIYGCGGGGGSASPLTITGTAATGTAISLGTVEAKCQNGTGTATTNEDGTYTMTIASGGTLPCLLRVTTTNPNTGVATALYSAVESGATTANITPLTQLVVANALGSDPATAYTAGVSSTNAANLTPSALTAAVSNMQSALAGLGVDISTTDPLKAALVAATDANSGNAQDKQIDGLMIALSNANVKVSDLTTVIAANTSSSASSTAIASFASTNSVSTKTMPSCLVARSGKYVYASPGDTVLNKVTLDFTTKTGSANGTALTITPDATIPCAYTFVVGGVTTVNVRVSASGLAAFSVGATASNSTPVTSTGVGLVVPVQTLPSFAQMAGTWYAMHYSKPVGSTITQNFYSKFVIAADGTATAYMCTGLGVCSTTATNTFTFTRDTTNNLLTARSTLDPTDTQVALFRNQAGDIFGLGVNTTASASWTNNYVIFSNRVSAFKNRTAGSTYSTWGSTISNPGGGALAQSVAYKTYTVNSIDTVNKSFTRTSDDATPVIDTIFLNTPQAGIGMIRRPAVTTPVAAKDFVGFTGNGWTVAGSTKLNATSANNYLDAAAANNFLSISIQPVN